MHRWSHPRRAGAHPALYLDLQEAGVASVALEEALVSSACNNGPTLRFLTCEGTAPAYESNARAVGTEPYSGEWWRRLGRVARTRRRLPPTAPPGHGFLGSDGTAGARLTRLRADALTLAGQTQEQQHWLARRRVSTGRRSDVAAEAEAVAGGWWLVRRAAPAPSSRELRGRGERRGAGRRTLPVGASCPVLLHASC